jgi:ABC-type nitrate/sulfonate/bicarbonate transport system permease component
MALLAPSILELPANDRSTGQSNRDNPRGAANRPGPPLTEPSQAAFEFQTVEPLWHVQFYRDHRSAIRGAYSVALALIAWELVGRYVLTSKLMFAPFSAVVEEFINLSSTGELQRHILASFSGLAIGFGLSALVGIALGSLIAMNKAVGEHLDPLINALYATPLVALSPILILGFGIGPASKIAIVFLLTVFPILINTTAGIKSTDESLIEAARSFGASRFEIFRLVLLPSALPFVVAGLRLGVGKGLVGIFIGELFGAREGLGYLISISSQSFDVPGMFVGVLVLAASGVVCVAVLETIEKRIAPWRKFDLKA